MRILLISPTHYNADGSLHKTTRYWTSGLTLPYLEALTPPGHEVDIVDELFYDVDLDTEYDLVGITAMGPQMRRAYDLADHFRAAGTRVVLGGTWVTLAPEASLEHADAVVAGEAEDVWPQLLADFCEGRSRGIYRAPRRDSLADLPGRLRQAAAAQVRRLQEQLALPHVLPLAGRLLARLPASLRLLRGADLLRPQLPHPPGRGSDRRSEGDQVLRRQPHPLPRRQPDRASGGGEGAVSRDDPAAAEMGQPVHHQHRPRPRAARPGGAQRLRQSVDRTREHQRGEPRIDPQRLQPGRTVSSADLAAIRAKGIQVIGLLMVGLDGDTLDTFRRSLQFLHRQQGHLPEAVHAVPLPRHQVPRRHVASRAHPHRRLGLATTTAARSFSRPT